ncbi:MAG: DUF5692 family protein [Atopobiaceae bacterium]|jgi:hypothetical protein|nr:DUF5692 family protein [Atopobiaceae bacterium]MCH4180259.1 DUF5692 family protein [Atopobiaceae bacterium]MCH4214745.1 DUF5692 family protein [Atopobiaceae bacterium]MCH4229140.1 DUF5692 family protein [Atopobiaceae bacterium]MCH4276511.1 DUF5692 family protein [Atopobiaceae bacterium]
MLFDVYGENSLYQWLGWLLVFVVLILLNEVSRRSKAGGLVMFGVLPVAMTVYCIVVTLGAGTWAANNPTVLFQNGWFHYAKVYAALVGCLGFMVIKYHWGRLGKASWFRWFPFVIVAVNILIAVASDFESAMHYFDFLAGVVQTTDGGRGAILQGSSVLWVTSEHATEVCGWNNVLNGVAGIVNIFCMTGLREVYSSRRQQDMVWADMTWVYIIAYDLWNFCYTYNCLPNHAWYCGLALLLAPTVANALWNRGGWIQNRANTLAIWCMFAQVFPQFQDSFPQFGYDSVFAVQSTLDTTTATVVALVALVANCAALAYVIYRGVHLHRNPYGHEVFVGTRDYEQAHARIEPTELMGA